MRWYKVVFAVLFAMLMLVGVLAFLLTRHMTALGLDMLLSRNITSVLGNKVVIGNIRIADFRTIEADDVTLFEKSGAPMVQVPKVEVRFSPFGILSGMSPDNFISSITAYDVKAFLVERKKNTWNVEEIGEGKPKSPKTEPFKFKPEIRIVNATVSATFASGAKNIASDVTGILDMSESDMVRFKANVGKVLGTKVLGSGYFDLAKSKLALSFHTDKIDLHEGSFLFIWRDIPEVDVKLLSGYANNLDVFVTIPKDEDVRFSVYGDCVDASADIFGVPVRNVFGRIEINEKKVSLLNGRASVYGDTVNITGDFNFAPKDFRDFELNVVAVGKGLHTSIVNRFLPGFMPVDCQVDVVAVTHGKLAKLNVEADIESNNVAAFGYRAQKVQAKAALIEGNTIVVSDGIVSAYGGTARFAGDFDINKLSYNLKAAGSNVDVKQIPWLSNYGVGAVAAFSVNMNGNNIEYVKTATGNIFAQNVTYDKYLFDSVLCGFNYYDKNFGINYLNIDAYGGKFSAYGKLGNNLAFKGRMLGVDGSRLARIFGQNELSGTLDAAIDVDGTIDKPHATIRVDAANGRFRAQKYKNAFAELELFGRELEVKKFEARDDADGFAQAAGVINFEDSTLKLSGNYSDVLIQDIVRSISPKAKVLGAINGSFEVDGSFADPVLSAEFSTDSIVYERYLINKVAGKLELTKFGLVMRSLSLQALGGEVLAEGTWHEYSDMDFLIKVNGFELEKLPQNLGDHNLTGAISARVFLKGSLDEPMLFGKVTSPSITFNEERYTDAWAEFTLGKETLDVNQGAFQHKLGSVKFDGSLQLATMVFAGNLSMKDMEIKDILSTCGIKNEKMLNGALSLQSEFSGTIDSPTVKVIAQAPTLTSFGFGLDNFAAELSYSDRTLNISKFIAKRGDSIIAGKGTAVIDGPLSMEFGARNIDASLIPKWLGKDLPLIGNLSATAQISGTYQNPDVALSVTLDKPSYAGTQLDEIYGLLTINKDKISINQILFNKAGSKATLIGELPYNAIVADKMALATSAQMNLNLNLEDTDLNLLPLLFSEQVTYAKGRIGAKVNIGGNLQTPIVNGEFYVKNGELQLTALRERIHKIDVNVDIKNNQLSINNMRGKISDGSIDVAGGGRIFGWKLISYAFTAKAANVNIDSKMIVVPLNFSLNLDDRNGKPRLSGTVDFKDNDVVEVKLGSLLSGGADTAASSFSIPDFDLDVSVDLGKRLRVYNPIFFDVYATGKVHFGGSGAMPENSGQISIVRGSITYMNNEFNIETGTADFDRAGSYVPNVNLQAKAIVNCPDPINPTTNPYKTYTIYLSVKGAADNPLIKMTSDSGLSPTDIGYLLTTGQVQNANNPAMQGQGFTNQAYNTGLQFAQSAVFGSVGSSVRTNLGLDYFSLNRAVLAANSGSNNNQNNVSNQEIYQLQVGKYLFDKLLLKSSIGIGYNYYQLQAQYDLWQQLYITGSTDSQQLTSIVLNKIWTF